MRCAMRLTARATRDPIAFMPRPRASRSCASTIRCAWEPWSEYCTRRKPGRAHPAANERSIARTILVVRSEGASDRRRSVTCAGSLLNRARATCGSVRGAPGLRFRPAPARRPPHPQGVVNSKASCRGRRGINLIRRSYTMPQRIASAGECRRGKLALPGGGAFVSTRRASDHVGGGGWPDRVCTPLTTTSNFSGTEDLSSG